MKFNQEPFGTRVSPTLVHHFLEQSAFTFPDKVALRHGKVNATYREINCRANQFAHWLKAQGVVPGDRVALLMENCVEYVIGYYGALKSGAVIAPLSTHNKPEGLKPLLNSLAPKVILATSSAERLLKASTEDIPQDRAIIVKNPKLKWGGASGGVWEWASLNQGQPESDPGLSIDPTFLASIIFTSGSVGLPKGVMLTHANIVANTHSICRYLKLTSSDVQMVVLPFHYVMGKSLLNTHFAVGGSVIINNQFAYPATVVKEMADQKVTGFSGVPSTYAYLLHRSPLASYRQQLDALRYCSQAGGHMPHRIKAELRQALPKHTQIVIMYGATEAAARLSYLPPERFDEKMDSIGIAIPGVMLKVVGPDGTELPPGQVGELIAAGPNIMQGYWQDPESSLKVLGADDCYYTGDLCCMDEEGFLYLTGRRDDLIKVGGHRINPHEIEDALMETGLVIEAAVLGIKDEMLQNRLYALTALKDKDGAEDAVQMLLKRCAERLPRAKLPSEIVLCHSLPKSSSGKVDRKKCLEILQRSIEN